MARFAPSFLTTAAALGLMAGAALAQDFNAAPPNAPDQQPAFEGQTRAPVIADTLALKTETVVDGLSHPWALALLPDGAWLVTERPGRLRMVGADGTLSEPIAGLPEIDAKGQGGLLDVMVGPDFASDRRLWISYAAPAEGGNQTAVATAKLSADGRSLEEVKELFRQTPVYDGDKHFGSRLLLDGQGGLINKFEGDAALAIFGAPSPLADPCAAALRAARTIMDRLDAEVPEVQAGLGVSYGTAVAGNIGAHQRYEYTVIGDPVTEAARLSEHAKVVPGRVVVADSVVAGAAPAERGLWSPAGAVELRGRGRPTLLAVPASRAMLLQ